MQTTQNNSQPVSPIDLAEAVEHQIHEFLAGSPAAFHLEQARLYGVNVPKGAGEMTLTLVLEHADIYTLLDTPESACARMFDAAALVTCGWAAPISDSGEPGGAPSEHPGRRRVRLVVVVGDGGVASVLRFKDDEESPILDAGEARGPLAEAVNGFWYDPPVVS